MSKKRRIDVLERALEATTNEVQLLQWPYFCISTDHIDDTEMEYSETVRAHGQEITRNWVVRCHSSFGWPGQLEANVWRSIEHIMHCQRAVGVLTNPIVTTLSEIRRYMPGKSRGGSNLKAVIKAIKCLAHTKVDADFFYDAKEKLPRNASFSLVEEWEFVPNRRPDGAQRLEKTKLFINPNVFDNIAVGYVRPLDRGFRDNLRRWLAKRLYELLGVKFYALRKTRNPYRTRYKRLCGLLGCKQQRKFSKAKLILGRAHCELQESGFLSKVEWYSCKDDTGDWVIHYWPGWRAMAEWSRGHFKQAEIAKPLLVEALPETEAEPKWVEELEPDESGIVVEVVSTKTHDELEEKKGQKPIGLEEGVVIAAFERATGERRRMRKLSEAERALLDEWRLAGLDEGDITAGVWRVMKQERERSRRMGRSPREIWSLDYCAWAIWEAFEDRQQRYQQERETRRVEEKPRVDVGQLMLFEYSHVEEWPAVCAQLRMRLSPQNYARWIDGILGSRLDGTKLRLIVPDPFFREYLLDNYGKELMEEFGATEVEVEVADE